ncbi:YoaK family protein [Gordonia sp. LSe1-13]|uniref:YoaK family protein n=1 Tax=Gordonia sesuvii TaxID=3116777 RepID=A0ABU7MFZ9_9ACTN|nr:YoaK family protein [Gordonia sp. LSe1-13]
MTTTHAPPPSQTRKELLGPFYDSREMILAAVLAALAGATGAAAWLYSSGWYVTFMTGNTERLVLEHIKGAHALGLTALVTVLVFVLGVIVATLARVHLWRKARHGATVLTAGSTVAASAWDGSFNSASQEFGVGPVLCLAFGLGALNTSISRKGEVVMPLSYVTGTLVKIGQGVGLHIAGKKRWGWVAHASTYAGFLAGAGVGGLLFNAFNVQNSLRTLAVVAVAIAALTWRLDHPKFLKRDLH